MLTTFITTLKVLTRSPAVVLWAVAFPLVLSTLFHMMFGNLDAAYKLEPIRVVIVNDANYQKAKQFSEVVEVLGSDDAYEGGAILAPTMVASEDAALAALKDGDYYGYILLNSQGEPGYHMDSRKLSTGGSPAQSIIKGILDQYLQRSELIAQIAASNPQLFADPELVARLTEGAGASGGGDGEGAGAGGEGAGAGGAGGAGGGDGEGASGGENSGSDGFTERLQITANPPSDALRYYYAVLAFSTFMMSIFATTAINYVQGNSSPLGARRCLGGQSKLRTLAPTLAAAWILAFACMMVGFCYIRFVFGVSFGGKEPFVVLTMAVSALAVTFLGALFGSLPLPMGAKSGFVALLSNILSLFAGLYGTWSQNIGDFVARELPWLSVANPVRQVADAMFSLYYYDGYERLAQCLVSLLVFGAVFFIASTLILRRQRYASL
jgi:hypothetical protein